MKEPSKTSKGKRVRKKIRGLSVYDRLELSEYTKDEREQMFRDAIAELGVLGAISPSEFKEYLTNIGKWLAEELDN